MSIRHALLDLMSTVSNPLDAEELEKNVYIDRFVETHEAIVESALQKLREINDLYNDQVERFFPTETVPKADIELVHRKITEHYVALQAQDWSVIPEQVAAIYLELARQHQPLQSVPGADTRFPTNLALENDPDLVRLVSPIPRSKSYYCGRYKSQDCIVHLACTENDQQVLDTLTAAGIQCQFAAHVPDCVAPICTVGFATFGETMCVATLVHYTGEIFADTVLTKSARELMDDLFLCAKTLTELNRGGVLLLNLENMLLCRFLSTREWRVTSIGAALKNKDNEDLDAGILYLAAWDLRKDLPMDFWKRLRTQYPMRFSPERHSAPLFKKYNAFVRDTGGFSSSTLQN